MTKEWGIENGHFISWMRVAGLPSFRKLWGKVDKPLKAGSRIRVHYQDNFPVKEFGGRKTLVISTSSGLSGRKKHIGYGYIAVGGCFLIFGLLFLCVPKKSGSSNPNALLHCESGTAL